MYQPLASAPVPGSTVSMLVTDAGRVGLGPQIGAGAAKIEGVVESRDDSSVVLRMRSVSYINGQTNTWTNEKLVVANKYVTNASERQFSRSRTALVAAVTIGGVIAFIVSRGLFGIGFDGDDKKPDPGPPANN